MEIQLNRKHIIAAGIFGLGAWAFLLQGLFFSSGTLLSQQTNYIASFVWIAFAINHLIASVKVFKLGD